MEKNNKHRNKAVFLDRDGTLSHDRAGHYLTSPEKLRLYKKTIPALRLLSGKGYMLFMISNQSGIARGYVSRETVERIHSRLAELLSAEGVKLDGIYYCPHGPGDGCACRKPAPGMAKEIIRKFSVNPARSFVVGDKFSDLELGRVSGMKRIHVLTGQGGLQKIPHGKIYQPDFRAKDILSAAKWITKNEIPD